MPPYYVQVKNALGECDFDNLRRSLVEIAESQPLGSSADVGYARPGLSVTSVWEANEIGFFEALEFKTIWLIRDTFVLDGAFITIRQPADHQSDS